MKLFFAMFLAFAWSAQAQIEMNYDQGAVIQTVIEVDNTPAPDLYKSVMRWITKAYKDPAMVIKATLENEEVKGQGLERGALLLTEVTKVRNDFRYSFKIEVKDNRVRYTMYDMWGNSFPVEYYVYKKDGTEKTGGQPRAVKSSATEVATTLINSLQETLLNKDKKEDW
jgi:uncharacterized protein with TBP-like fold DUF4468